MKKTHGIWIVILVLAASAIYAAAPNTSKSERTKQAQSFDTDKYINANKILMMVANNGAFATDIGGLLGKTDGLYFPYVSVDNILDGTNDKSVVYSSGLWIGAVDSVTNDTLVTVAEYSQEFFPGNMIGNTYDSTGQSNPAYKVYKIYSDSLADNPNDDYTNWPVSQGAPVDSAGNPAILGDQMLWCVYNDAKADEHTTDNGSTAPLGIEIQQSTFAFNREDPLGNVVFLRFKILNKGGKTLKNMFISLWADPDLGGASDDYVGCDTLLSLGYCYNATNNDNAYGSVPPAVGYDFFQGPLAFTGNLADTARMFGQIYPQYKNLPMSSFNRYINGTDPHSYIETYRYQNGLDKDGNPDPNLTKFAVPGDPVTLSGDIDNNPADRRYMLTTGPFTFEPGDSTEILAAIVVAACGDRLSSVTALKYYDQFAQLAYEDNFIVPQPPATPVVNVVNLKNEVVLSWGTESEDNPGTFPFEGYTILQGPTASGPWKRIATYDEINGYTTVKDNVFSETDCALNFVATKFGTNSGIKREIEITEDAIKGGRLANNSKYFFRVEAYSHDPLTELFQKTLTSAQAVTALPSSFAADVEPGENFGEVLPVTQVGISDGRITPTVIDPLNLTGDTYLVKFDTLSAADTIWNLIDETTGDTLLKNQTNVSYDDNYVVVDGILVKVGRAGVGFKNFEVVANAGGPVDPPAAGSFGFQGFPSADPDDRQQVSGGLWGIHCADNGGTADGGTRGSFDSCAARLTRDGGNSPRIGINDFEIRFTGDVANPGVGGGYGYNNFSDGATVWVPFELWCIGAGSPNNTADDYRMVPWLLDSAKDDQFNLESWGSSDDPTPLGDSASHRGEYEHSFSGGDNDPFTDWVYWHKPDDTTPGEAGYNLSESELLASTYDGSHDAAEVFARMVFGQWNGGSAPPFAHPMPEQGTVFRISTYKPIKLTDEWRFTAPKPTTVVGNERLKNIRAVPNPYYLFSSYENNTVDRTLKFTNLPTKCTITIYTITGEIVRTLTKDSPESELAWDVENRFGIPVASGIYIYVVEAEGMGNKIGKVAVFTEEEQLNTY